MLFVYHQLLRQNKEELAHILSSENGKTIKEANGDIQRGIESVEAASSAHSLMIGDTLPEMSSVIDGASYRYPLCDVDGMTQYNFSTINHILMLQIALASGNTFVFNPSVRTPLTSERLVELFMEAGLPKGVLNMVNGAHDTVNGILEDPVIQAVSFVG